ncbi:MAG: hypothetical protein KJO82_14985, partial [Gammaproteobacteria bacterium]|nr:hypothetical protein [Gammaproteobacteria bacterium]
MRNDPRRFRLTTGQSKRIDGFTRRRFLTLTGGVALASVVPGCSRDDHASPSGPAPKDELHYATLTDVAQKIKSRELSPVELTKSLLSRIEAVDSRLKSYVTVTSERALAAARVAEDEIASGVYRGPMHGIPVAVKDL